MLKRRFASAVMATSLLVGAGGLAACDKEDRRDVEEGVNQVDEEVDQLDNDGKDD